jgi:hypothetical protein
MSFRALSEPVVAMSKRLAGPISLAAFALLCGAVVSQPAPAAPKLCGDHDQILKRLEQSPPGNPAGDRSFRRRRDAGGAGLARGRLDHAGHVPEARRCSSQASRPDRDWRNSS